MAVSRRAEITSVKKVNRGVIDVEDVIEVYKNANAVVTGNVITDLNGDQMWM